MSNIPIADSMEGSALNRLAEENERLQAELARMKEIYGDGKFVDLNSHIEVIGEAEYVPYLVAKNMIADVRAELAAHIAWGKQALDVLEECKNFAPQGEAFRAVRAACLAAPETVRQPTSDVEGSNE